MTLNQTVPLDLNFKGERDYLRGTDIFNALVDLTCARDHISLRLHRVMRNRVEAVRIHDVRTNLKEFAGLFLYGNPESLQKIGLREDPMRPILGRYAYDDDRVIADANVFGKRISPVFG